jgi:hypothetical protein
LQNNNSYDIVYRHAKGAKKGVQKFGQVLEAKTDS